MALTILNVAFPFAPVRPDAAGGAEHVVAQLDRLLVEAGHRSIVLACEGSVARGDLVAIPACPHPNEPSLREISWRAMRAEIERIRATASVDVVHMHGLDFHRYLVPTVPTLVTLHLPLSWYDKDAWSVMHPRLRFNCVSMRQQSSGPINTQFLAPIDNSTPAVTPRRKAKRSFALVMCRICPEKGVHLAIEAARMAETPLVIAGRVFPYPEHEAYFESLVRPQLDSQVRFVGPAGPQAKSWLFSKALCLLAPSLVDETSSLVAMESLAQGVPVVAFNRGALVDIVEHGRTGFIVADVPAMAAAIKLSGVLSPEDCRSSVAERFSEARMFSAYLAAYRSLADERCPT